MGRGKGAAMAASRSRTPRAGGIAIALGIVAGPIVGALTGHQPTLGLLVGVGAGVLVALAIWLLDRR